LAKELAVKSSAIVKKCQDEGLEVKNHMSVISAGLAATIREWFSEGEHVTTVETAERVDLKKVRIKKKVKRKAVPKMKTKAATAKRVKKKTTKRAKPAAKAPGAAEEEPGDMEAAASQVQQAVEVDSGTAVATEEPPAAQAERVGPVIVEGPKEPEPILPAGPILENVIMTDQAVSLHC